MGDSKLARPLLGGQPLKFETFSTKWPICQNFMLETVRKFANRVMFSF